MLGVQKPAAISKSFAVPDHPLVFYRGLGALNRREAIRRSAQMNIFSSPKTGVTSRLTSYTDARFRQRALGIDGVRVIFHGQCACLFSCLSWINNIWPHFANSLFAHSRHFWLKNIEIRNIVLFSVWFLLILNANFNFAYHRFRMSFYVARKQALKVNKPRASQHNWCAITWTWREPNAFLSNSSKKRNCWLSRYLSKGTVSQPRMRHYDICRVYFSTTEDIISSYSNRIVDWWSCRYGRTAVEAQLFKFFDLRNRIQGWFGVVLLVTLFSFTCLHADVKW